MFWHVFKNRLKIVLRERTLVFWSLIFPIILVTLFNFSFSNINEMYKFKTINIAVVEDEVYKDEDFMIVLDELSSGSDKIFDIVYVNLEEANELLENGEISSYILLQEELELVVNESGYDQTIVKHILDNYAQVGSVISNLFKTNPTKAQEVLLAGINMNENYVETEEGKDSDMVVVNYYGAIALACIYGGFFGLKTINEMEANLSSFGIKNVIAPFKKTKIYIPSFMVDVFIQTICGITLITYLVIIGLDFGGKLIPVYFITILGGIIGILIGSALGLVGKFKENTKIGIFVASAFTLAFLSGMVAPNIKHIIQTNAPLLAKINPANLISDGLYSLYYYDNMNRYYINVISLVVIGLILLSIIAFAIRRRQYDSI